MLLLVSDDEAFVKLIYDQIPALVRWKPVRAALKKYSSGYLNEKRLDLATKPGLLPVVQLASIGDAAGGRQSGDTITIDKAYFSYFKQGHFNYVHRVPITVLHELGHWGCWKVRKSGQSLDQAGRDHDNHGDYKSPLTAELEALLAAHSILSLPRSLL